MEQSRETRTSSKEAIETEVTRGLNSYDRKNKRRIRRENHEEFDLRYPKKEKRGFSLDAVNTKYKHKDFEIEID